MALSSKNLKIGVNSRKYSSPIVTATYAPFTQGTEVPVGCYCLCNSPFHFCIITIVLQPDESSL